MKKPALILLAILTSQVALADQTIFSCSTKNGKQLSITEARNNFQYSFGYPNKPELTFKNKSSDFEEYSGMWYSVYTMKNGKWKYAVTDSGDEDTMSSKVEVYNPQNKLVATVPCIKGSVRSYRFN